jgi:hypothetical protein
MLITSAASASFEITQSSPSAGAACAALHGRRGQREQFVFLHKQKREALFKTVGTYYVQFVPMGTFNFVYNLYLVLILY